MKKLIIVLISVILLLALTSCDFNSVFDGIVEEKPDATELFLSGDKGYSEYSGVYLTFDGAEYVDGAWHINVGWHNESSYEVVYGLAYTIEYYDGGKWVDVKTTDFAVEEIACVVMPNKTADKTYTTKYFDVSRDGKYRLRTEFNISDESYTGSRIIALEFSLSAEPQETLPPIEEPTVKETWGTTIPNETEIADQPADGKVALEVVGAECLYEPLEKRYEPGTKVTVKIDRHIGTVGSNTGFFAVIDGKQAEIKWTDEYQYFEFIMPESNATLYMRSYSTELIDSPYADLFVHAFWAENPHLPAVMVKRYYGENYGENKEGIPVALIDTGEEYYGDPVVEKVGELEFRYEGLNRIWLVYDKFYTISDAYEAGILTDSDVARIYSLHNSGQEG